MTFTSLSKRARRLLFRRCAVLRFFLLLSRAPLIQIFPPLSTPPRFSSLRPLPFFPLFGSTFSLISVLNSAPPSPSALGFFAFGFMVLKSEFLRITAVTDSPLFFFGVVLKVIYFPFMLFYNFFRLCRHFLN